MFVIQPLTSIEVDFLLRHEVEVEPLTARQMAALFDGYNKDDDVDPWYRITLDTDITELDLWDGEAPPCVTRFIAFD
jgi:hypothetical protein